MGDHIKSIGFVSHQGILERQIAQNKDGDDTTKYRKIIVVILLSEVFVRVPGARRIIVHLTDFVRIFAVGKFESTFHLAHENVC